MNGQLAKRVCLTGIGAITPFANGWENVLHNISTGGASIDPWNNDLEPPCSNARLGLVKDYPKTRYCTERQLRLMDRAMALSVTATGLAFEDAKVSEDCRIRIGDQIATVIATMRGELPSRYRFGIPLFDGGQSAINPAHFPMISPNIACGQIALQFGLRGWSTTISSGEIAGLHALARAIRLVAMGRAQMAVVGAYEVFSKISLHYIKAHWQKCGRHTLFLDDSNTDAPVEGACVFVVESEESAAQRGVEPYALLGEATHGYLHDDASSSCPMIADRFLARANAIVDGWDVIMSSIGSTGVSAGCDEHHLVRALAASNPDAIELRVRPIFGDSGAQSIMFQVACAAQMLKSQKIDPIFMRGVTCETPRCDRPIRGAIATQLTNPGAYGLISMGRA